MWRKGVLSTQRGIFPAEGCDSQESCHKRILLQFFKEPFKATWWWDPGFECWFHGCQAQKKTCQTKEFGDVFFDGKTQKSIEVPKICIFFKTRTLPSPLSGVRGVTSMRCKQSKPLELHITNLSSPFLSFRWCVGSVVRRSSSRIASWPPQGMPRMWTFQRLEKMEQGENFIIFFDPEPGFKRSLLLSRDNQKTQTEVENSWRRQSTKRTSMEKPSPKLLRMAMGNFWPARRYFKKK